MKPACARDGDWERALGLLFVAKSVAADGRTAPAGLSDVRSFGAAVGACEKAARWDVGLALLEEMRRRALAPNVAALAGRWLR